MKKMRSNLILSFLTGIFAYYIIARTITMSAIMVCLAATGILAIIYLVIFLIKKNRQAKG
ncbi:hypothetical protein B2I21_14920 [Chryseobacterium mucoviscidosis]|nr:hypothetical protein B2I21_14920 [Chryseobacterium mucoviscidosis]